MSEPTSTEKTTKTEGAPAVKAGKKKSSARELARERGRVKNVKASREPRSKVEKAPGLCVFAFRLSESDRDRIHAASGPARASKFVLAAALAAANSDQKAFDALVTQAKANLK